MVQAINLALREAMARDANVVILGQDVGVNGGVFRVTEGLRSEFGEKRVIDTPLAESAIVGSSVGMAINGLRPICELQFSGFSYQGF
jgi:pyruvate dehydrogenase E1 component beta subunit